MAQAEAPTQLSTPSIDPEEVEKFSRIAGEWWDPKSKFAPLHKFNPARLTYIRELLSRHFNTDGAEPLKGLKVLDIGCGDGLFRDVMRTRGWEVQGVDVSEDVVWHAKDILGLPCGV